MISQGADEVGIEDLLQIASHLPLRGEIVALDNEQQSYLLAATRRYGVSRTWKALSRTVQTGNYGPDDVVKVMWAILRGQRENA